MQAAAIRGEGSIGKAYGVFGKGKSYGQKSSHDALLPFNNTKVLVINSTIIISTMMLIID